MAVLTNCHEHNSKDTRACVFHKIRTGDSTAVIFFTVEQLRHFAVHTQVSQVMKGHGMLFLTRMFSRGTPGYCLESRGLLGYQIDLSMS